MAADQLVSSPLLHSTDTEKFGAEPQGLGLAGSAGPTAPPTENMDSIAGYENLVAGACPPPPPYEEAVQPVPTDASRVQSTAIITAEQAKEALMLKARKHCCWGKKAAQHMSVTQIQTLGATHYILKSFGEKRTTEWHSEPFLGQPIDGPSNGRAPTPWEIIVNPPPPFVECTVDMEVPHTASVKPCYYCHGCGTIDCSFCHHGRKDCTSCNPQNRAQCTFCNGHGHQTCFTCNGTGRVDCSTCSSTGLLKCYIIMHIRYKVHTSDFIEEKVKTGLTSSRLRKADGVVLFKDEAQRVWPITNYPDPAINDASQRLVNEHASTIATTERILIQRQVVRAVPVNQCSYTYKNKPGMFYVYGTDNLVYAPDYPQQCCWGCYVL